MHTCPLRADEDWKGSSTMKYVIVLGDGMADEPIDALGGKTPLEAANTPAMDALASMGTECSAVHGPRQRCCQPIRSGL